MDSIAVTYALLDPVMTILRPISAIFSAILAGVGVNILDKEAGAPARPTLPTPITPLAPATFPETQGESACCDTNTGAEGCGCTSGCGCGSETPQGWRAKLKHSLNFSFGELMADIGPWFIVGSLAAGLITALIPDEFLSQHLGQGLAPMLLMLVVAIPLYVCATASTPVVAALAMKGLSPGSALVFLLAGPATNTASLAMVRKVIGDKATGIYLGSIAVTALGLGFFADWLYIKLGMSITSWAHAMNEHGPSTFATVCAIILLALILRPLARSFRRPHGSHAAHGH